MLTKGTSVALFASALALSGAAFAAYPSVSSALSGVYVEGNIGVSKVSDKDYSNEEGLAGLKIKNKKSGLAGSVNVGYQFHPNFAVEAGIIRFNNGKHSVKSGTTTLSKFTSKTYAFDVVLKGTAEINDEFSVFAKAGLASVHYAVSDITVGGAKVKSQSESTVTGIGGVGVAYKFNENVSLNVQAMGTPKAGKVPATAMLTAGVSYNF